LAFVFRPFFVLAFGRGWRVGFISMKFFEFESEFDSYYYY